MKLKRWSRPAYAAFSVLFITIMCFALLPSPVQIGNFSFGGAGVARASGENWLTGYSYRVAVTIGNATGAGTNYQVKLLIGETSGATGENFDLSGHTIDTTWSDGVTDLKFSDNDGSTLLDFWWESTSGSGANELATYWVEVADSLESSAVTIYCYYGKTGDTYSGNGTATFIFFDDFSTAWNNPAKWTGDTAQGSVSAGILTYTYNTIYTTKEIFSSVNAGPATFAVRTLAKMTKAAANYDWIAAKNSAASHWAAIINNSNVANLDSNDGATYSSAASNWTAATYKTWDIYVRGGTNMRVLENGVELTGSPKTTNPANSTSMYVNLGVNSSGSPTVNVDWILIRKYQLIEPAFSSVGAEEAPLTIIATLAATSITTTSATLNGNVTSLGDYGNVTSYGFVLSTTSVANSPGNVSPSAQTTYTAGNWTWTDVQYAAGTTFDSNGNVTGLTSGTCYYFRAAGYSTYGWVYGNELSFTTIPGGNFLTGYPNRIKIETTSSSAITGDAEIFDAYYNSAAIEADSCTQFLHRPAARYVGTHDRTYIAGADRNAVVTIRQWDEDDLTLSTPSQLWDFSGSDDHTGCSVIVLQHQTGGNVSENGTILVATGTRPDLMTASRRSDNAEDISSWGDSNIIQSAENGWYPFLTETSDGTIRCFYQISGGPSHICYRVLTLADNPDDDSWGAEVVVTTTYADYGKPWVDGNDIHIIFGYLDCCQVTGYYNVWYIKYQGNDTTWRAADGTQRYLPMDFSAGNKTPDVVTATDYPTYSDVIWDIKTDTSHNPYLIYINSTGTTAHGQIGDIIRAHYSAGWQCVDTGINAVRFGIATSGTFMSGAELKEGNVSVIYAGVPDGSSNSQIEAWERLGNGTWQLADGTNGTTAIAGDGRITQASPGYNFRPITVLNGGGHFEILWFYSEQYVGIDNWEAMRMAYPGFSNQNFLCLNKLSRTDFGDLRLTQGDGSTLQPSASSGQPWIQEKVDSWRAILWWKIGNIPASPLLLTNYVNYGNSTNTNANTQAIMDAQFLACDGFDNGTTLDTNKWTMTDTVTVASGNLVLTSTDGTRGIIFQKAANYPFFTYSAIYIKWVASDSTPGPYYGIGLYDGSANAIYIMPGDASNTANTVYDATLKDSVDDHAHSTSKDIANWSIWSIGWSLNSAKFYQDLIWGTQKSPLTLETTLTAQVPIVAQGLWLIEGSLASTGTVLVDWIFALPIPSNGILPTVLALTQELLDISNTLSSWSVGVVQPSQTYWANGAEPSWPLNTSDCWGNLTNNSSFAVNILASMTNMTGGTTWSIGSSPGTNVFTLKIGIAGLAGIGNFTTLSNTPVAWITSMAAGNMTRWTMVFYTPTNTPQFADGALKSGTMTFEAEPS